jgi:hypothetical protein
MDDVAVRDVGDDRVIATFRLTATGRSSGAEVTRRDAMTFVLRDGKVVRQDYYNNEEEALTALGLV